MKKIISLLLFSFCLFSAEAQQWHTDFTEAKKIATEENKKIILVFSGSDWSSPCTKLKKNVWNTGTFKQYAKNNYVLINADFPRKKKNKLTTDITEQNKNLANKYNPKGYFPFVAVLNSGGKVIGKTGYIKTTAEHYIDHLNSF